MGKQIEMTADSISTDQLETRQDSFLKICVHLCPIGGFSFLVSLAFSLWLAVVVGRNLGLFFGGLVLASLLAPLLSRAEDDFVRRMSITMGIVVAIAMVWLSGVFNDTISLWEWFRGTLVLLI